MDVEKFKKSFVQQPLRQYNEHFQKSEGGDSVIVNVPLFIRLLEWAREDAKTDMDLHKVTENIINLVKHHNPLMMSDYEKIVKIKK